ncbi:MAG: DUF3800 domain-containing protein [Terriglobales bacterium]
MAGLYTNYVDDSGTDPNQRIAVASGLIIPGARIPALQKEWDRLREKEGFSDFHTSEFVAKNYKSAFAKWTDEKHARVFLRVRQICKKYGAKCVAFSVLKKDYDEVVPADMKKYWGQYHYTWAMRQFIVWMYQKERALSGAPMEYVFDYMDPSDANRKEIEKVMQQAEDMTGNTDEFKHFGFRPRREVPGLQCADLLAWLAYQVALQVFCNKPMSPYAKLAWEDFDKHPHKEWRTVRTVQRWGLEHLVHKERTSGESLMRFKEWEEKHG